MKVAVYGTLRYGGRANHLLRGCKRIEEDTIKGTLYNLGSFPGVKLSEDGDEVVVDVYEVPEESSGEVLQRLDHYEGYFPSDPSQSLYVRSKIKTGKGHEDVWVYVYHWPVHEDLKIPSGDWFNHG